MVPLRTLAIKLLLDSRDAVKGLKAYDRLWKTAAKGVEASATIIERSADRAVAALQRMGDAAAVARGAAAGARSMGSAGGGSGARGGGGGGQRSGGQSSPVIDRIVATGAKVSAAQSGLAAGSKAINDATAGLGKFATASDRARAKVADLVATVARNREEMARLKRQAIETGDADGTLAARMRGLSVATLDATHKLAGARRELRSVEGGLIDTIKAAGGLRGALAVAGGNLLSGITSRVAGGVAGAVGGAAQAAMDFEKRLVDVRKVAKGVDDTDAGFARLTVGIKAASTELGVMPEQVAALTAQLTAGFTGKVDLVELTKDVARIGVAWDITGEQAGEYFKQTSAGLQLEAAETKQLFGTYNELSNAFGIQAKDIAEAMTRSAGLLKGANLSGEVGAALNATLIKTGASADIAATGVKTFVRSIGAGATAHQVQAFKDLGLSMETVRANLSSGDQTKARKEIEGIVKALDELGKDRPEKRLEAMVNLFGSESIGSIGAAATATKLLGEAFDIAGNKGAALESVQKEYNRVSDTTAARADKLKAQVGVLAIEFGEALLPHIDKVVEFLTSPEGKEWGAKAVKTAAEAVTTFAAGVAKAAEVVGYLVDKFGGATVAVAALGGAVLALAGPFAAAAAAGIAAGAAITNAFMGASAGLDAMRKKADDIRHAELEATLKAGKEEIAGQEAEIQRSAGADSRREALAEKYAAKLKAQGLSDNEVDRRVLSMRLASKGQGRWLGGGTEDERLDAWGKMLADGEGGGGSGGGGGGGGGSDRAANSSRFDELVRMRNASADPLPPDEAQELRRLSKSLNRAIPHKPGKGRTHKATKMDRQLAAIDPSVRGVLTRGGETDKGGDMKVADNALDRLVFGKANAANGMGGSGGGLGSVGPGPNITNHYTYINTIIEQAIDARGPGNSSDNLASAGRQVANEAAGAIRLTGADSLKASRLAGGVRRGPA